MCWFHNKAEKIVKGNGYRIGQKKCMTDDDILLEKSKRLNISCLKYDNEIPNILDATSCIDSNVELTPYKPYTIETIKGGVENIEACQYLCMESNLKRSPREPQVVGGELDNWAAGIISGALEEQGVDPDFVSKIKDQNRKDCNYFEYQSKSKYCYLRWLKGDEKEHPYSSAGPAFCPVGLGIVNM